MDKPRQENNAGHMGYPPQIKMYDSPVKYAKTNHKIKHWELFTWFSS